MRTLHSYGHNNIGDAVCKLAGSLRLILRERASGWIVAANGIRKRRLLCEGSDPRREALTVNDPKTLTTDGLGAQHRSAQLLVSADRVYGDSAAQPGLIRFFCAPMGVPSFGDGL
jgi:hypothetical protein